MEFSPYITLNMEAVNSTEKSTPMYQFTLRHPRVKRIFRKYFPMQNLLTTICNRNEAFSVKLKINLRLPAA